jgi:hypothetical protein
MGRLRRKADTHHILGSNAGLQVCLEIHVITHFTVDLQAIPLAFGHDDTVRFRIEVDRRREAETPFRLQAPRSPAGFHHVGVGVDALLTPFGHHLRVAEQVRNRSPLGVEDAHPMITPISHVDIAIRIDGYVCGVIELASFNIARRA